MSQRLLGKLSSFYTFYRLYILLYTPLIICFMLIYSSIQLYYNLYLLLQPIFSLFFVFLALPTEVKPLCKSQFVTVQRIDVDVDAPFWDFKSCSLGLPYILTSIYLSLLSRSFSDHHTSNIQQISFMAILIQDSDCPMGDRLANEI